jgi:hypothetical protein
MLVLLVLSGRIELEGIDIVTGLRPTRCKLMTRLHMELLLLLVL